VLNGNRPIVLKFPHVPQDSSFHPDDYVTYQESQVVTNGIQYIRLELMDFGS